MGEILELALLRTREGTSKGCAFVSYEQQQSAEAAIQALDGHDVGTRRLSVKFADRK